MMLNLGNYAAAACAQREMMTMKTATSRAAAADQAQRTVDVAAAQGVPATLAGVVEAGEKELLIEPLGLHYAADALQLR